MMLEKFIGHDFLFDDFVLNSNGALSFHGQDVAIPPKELQVLISLLKGNGSIVGKDEIIEQVWGSYPVGDESLTRCIYSLRRILRENKKNKYIDTIYGRGYRFCKAVTLIPRQATAANVIKLAIFPFRGVAPALASELHTSLLDSLAQARLPCLAIMPAALTRSSGEVTEMLQLCQQLSLDYYLSGEFSVERSEPVLLLEWISAANQQLYRRQTLQLDGHADWGARLRLWSQEVPACFPQAIASGSQGGQGSSEVMLSHVLARRCLRGRERGDLCSALQYLQMGLAQEPLHVPSLIALAETYLAMAMHGEIWPENAFSQARSALEKAVNLAPDNPATLGVLGWLTSLSHDGPVLAASLFSHAVSLPGGAAELYLYHAVQLCIQGDFERSNQALNTCLTRDSQLAPAQLFKLWLLHLMGRSAEALQFGLTCAEMGGQTPRFYGVLSVVLADADRFDEADHFAQQALEIAPSMLPERIHHAMVQARGDQATARSALFVWAEEAQSRYRCPGLLAALALRLGEEALAAQLVRLAREQRCVWLPLMRVTPAMVRFAEKTARA